MTAKLLRKEFELCLHPTCLIFLSFAAFVFIPNYPYEVMFFFSGLSTFFVCITSRENRDLEFTCTLPVAKSLVPRARIHATVLLQCALVGLAGIAVALKETLLPASAQVNEAGNTANIAFIGYGFILLGVFDLLFFPKYFARPERVGAPFLVASVAVFVLIGALTTLRFASPFFGDFLGAPDPAHLGAKLTVLAIGAAVYAACVISSVKLSARAFGKVNL